jgi:hypothetical protein
MQAWIETEIVGLTSRPIRLLNDFAQTYHPGHHNFWEEFLFDPWLEPGLDPDLAEELRSENIRALIVNYGDQRTEMLVWGLDGKFREL